MGFGGSDCGETGGESQRGPRVSQSFREGRGSSRQKEAVSPVWPTTTQYNLEHFPGGHLPDSAGTGHLRGGVAGGVSGEGGPGRGACPCPPYWTDGWALHTAGA